MLRFKTLFGRLLATYMLIALSTILLLAVMTTQMLRWNSVRESTNTLRSSVQSVNDLFADFYRQNRADSRFAEALSARAASDQIDLWICDRFNIIWFSAAGDPALAAYQENLLDRKEELFQITQDSRIGTSVVYDQTIYATPVITVAAPLQVDGVTVGAVFAHQRLTELETYLKLIYSQLLICGIVSAALAFLMIFFTARNIERPLFQINAAAKELTRGNYGKRIKIRDQSEIGQLAQTFNQLAEGLEKYEGTRSSFVANVSHELKSPLTSIQGFVQGMLDGTIAETDRNQYLEIVLHETQRLATLTRDLLDLAKAESGQFPLNVQPYDINEQIRRCFIGFLPTVEEKNLDVMIDLPEEKTIVLADEDRIAQVLTNLIDNAVKFCNKEGQLKIWTYLSGARVFVNILNTGAVIPSADIPFVFDRFFKVDKSHNRKSPGTGIGLSLVRSIINQHGEEVSVNSDPKSGTVFTFPLRLDESQPSISAPS